MFIIRLLQRIRAQTCDPRRGNEKGFGLQEYKKYNNITKRVRKYFIINFRACTNIGSQRRKRKRLRAVSSALGLAHVCRSSSTRRGLVLVTPLQLKMQNTRYNNNISKKKCLQAGTRLPQLFNH